MLILLKTGSLFQYFRPSHNRLVAMFSCVTGSGSYVDNASSGGGVGPPRVTEEKKPDECIASTRVKIMFDEGTDVIPSRALEAFWRCEHTCDKVTRDMMMGRPAKARPPIHGVAVRGYKPRSLYSESVIYVFYELVLEGPTHKKAISRRRGVSGSQ